MRYWLSVIGIIFLTSISLGQGQMTGLYGNLQHIERFGELSRQIAISSSQQVDCTDLHKQLIPTTFDTSIAYLYGCYDVAIELAQRHTPSDPQVRLRLSESLLLQGKLKEAEAAARGFVSGNYFAMHGSKLCHSQAAHTLIVRYYDLGLALNGVSSYEMLFVGRCYVNQLNNPIQGEVVFRSLINRGYESAFAYTYLGRAIERSGGNPREAVGYYERALEMGSFLDAYNGALNYWKLENNDAEMYRLLEHATENGLAQHPLILLHWAHYYYLIGDADKGQLALNQATENIPQAPWTASLISQAKEEYRH